MHIFKKILFTLLDSLLDFVGFIKEKLLLHFLDKLSNLQKRYLVASIDFCVSLSLFYVVSYAYNESFRPYLVYEGALFSIIFLFCMIATSNYRVFWRLFGHREIVLLAFAHIFSIALYTLLFNKIENLYLYALAAILQFNVILFIRLLYASLGAHSMYGGQKENVVILGAGAAGTQIFKQLKAENGRYNPVCFLDDSPSLQKMSIDGVPVIGKLDQLSTVCSRYQISFAILAIPSADTHLINKVHSFAQLANIKIKMIPKLSQILDNKVNVKQIKDIEVQDLLGRETVNLNNLVLNKRFFDGEVVLVTGGGGSIGDELCFQIGKLKPKKLIVLEQTEYSLYKTKIRLNDAFPNLDIDLILGDVRDRETCENILSKFKPTAIFHAAAYKHVPIIEENPGEAVVTNITGTYNLASAAVKYGVERFVLISSDKAVNPTNIMGATKRAAELVCLDFSEKQNTTKFMMVRFGNVLGSSGSVIPLFQKQIAAGGPITITHKDITRYFMSIPEASQLVIYAGAIGNGGELFVLDMGEPVKILDLAERMIYLSGMTPGKEIKIKFTGLRRGEKMYEELSSVNEIRLKTQHPKIMTLDSGKISRSQRDELYKILNFTRNTQAEVIKRSLRVVVEGYI